MRAAAERTEPDVRAPRLDERPAHPGRQQVNRDSQRQAKPRNELPEIEPDFGERPHQGRCEQREINPDSKPAPAPDEHPRSEGREPGKQVIPGAAEAREPGAVKREPSAQHDEQAAQRLQSELLNCHDRAIFVNCVTARLQGSSIILLPPYQTYARLARQASPFAALRAAHFSMRSMTARYLGP